MSARSHPYAKNEELRLRRVGSTAPGSMVKEAPDVAENRGDGVPGREAPTMEYCNPVLTQWHQAQLASIQQMPHRPQMYGGSYFGGDGRTDYLTEHFSGSYQQYQASTMPMQSSASATNTGHPNLAMVASGSGTNSYGLASHSYLHPGTTSDGAATANYCSYGEMQLTGHPVLPGQPR